MATGHELTMECLPLSLHLQHNPYESGRMVERGPKEYKRQRARPTALRYSPID